MSTVDKKVPTASKAVKKSESKIKKADSESKSREKLISKTADMASRITEISENISELTKELASLIRKSGTIVGVEKKSKPQTEKAFLNQQWKAYCSETFPIELKEEMEHIQASEGKTDNRGLKIKAITSLANKYKETMKDLYETVINVSKRKYIEEYLTKFETVKEAHSTGEESETDDATTEFAIKSSKMKAKAGAGAGAFHDTETDTYESDKGSADEEEKPKKKSVKTSKAK